MPGIQAKNNLEVTQPNISLCKLIAMMPITNL